MTLNHLVRKGLAVGLFVFTAIPALAVMPTNPVTDAEFTRLPSGIDLRTISVSGTRLSLSHGQGTAFTARAQAAYEKLKNDSKNIPGHNVQWVLMDLDAHRVVDQSLENNRKFFGASSSKIFVGATLLDKQAGDLSRSQLQLMSEMLAVSSNTAWTDLQRQAGDGSDNQGRQRVMNFTQRMGYQRMRGFQGFLGDIHGNELTALETAEFLHDTYKNLYTGAETLWKLMHTCRTGSERGRKYIPESIFVGAKTGTYDGETVDPETGSTQNPNGSAFQTHVRNHVLVFYVEGRQYGLTILADTGSDESAAVLAGGLIREYAGVKP